MFQQTFTDEEKAQFAVEYKTVSNLSARLKANPHLMNDPIPQAYPQPREFPRLPGETDEQIVERWRRGFLASGEAPTPMFYNPMSQPNPSHSTGTPSNPNAKFMDFTLPDQPDSILSRFMPVANYYATLDIETPMEQ